MSNTATVSCKWSIREEQPKICQPRRGKARKTIFGCISPWEGCLIEQVEEKGNTRPFFSFLLKVVRACEGKKVYMPLENVKFHHGKRLQPVLKRFEHRTELLFLPPYSPDLNPMERVWWLMRKRITHNRWLKTMEQRVLAQAH
ncbi:hypothetical protein EZS27_017736 [termite gut metagenome]|uniref:Tc1-like transposase DDE domain-containing protein n=1 Tax=termite gut metagenome TaxID=433724 RepID=A0A5J4RJX0_9ZZZZ